jgi:hypothetical protein
MLNRHRQGQSVKGDFCVQTTDAHNKCHIPLQVDHSQEQCLGQDSLGNHIQSQMDMYAQQGNALILDIGRL